jgi:phosphoribosylanthranilate isomerase
MIAHPRVKICGVRSIEIALGAAEAGADLLGFNFAPVSKRRVELAVARAAIDAVRALSAGSPRRRPQGRQSPNCHAERSEASVPLTHGGWGDDPILRFAQDDRSGRIGPAMVGIFVNQPIGDVARAAAEVGLDFVQLSGDESPEYCREVAERSGRPVIKAIRLNGDRSKAELDVYAADGVAAVLLADAAVPGSWGGSGVAWDWGAAAALAARRPLLLAGGLTPENVGGALAAVRPWGVDVASGVETAGMTDLTKVRAFVDSANEEMIDGSRNETDRVRRGASRSALA